jgi:chromosome segregation ATPase
MSEPSLTDLFRLRWLESACLFWPETPRERLESKLAQLEAELVRRQNGLLLCRKKIEKLRDRLKRREHNLRLLATLLQKSPMNVDAYSDLNRQQQSIHRLYERLQQCECSYSKKLAGWRHRKREWTELRRRFLSGSFPKLSDEVSSQDYPF